MKVLNTFGLVLGLSHNSFCFLLTKRSTSRQEIHKQEKMIKFSDPTNIRQIIVCATLSERPVVIENYRAFEKAGV